MEETKNYENSNIKDEDPVFKSQFVEPQVNLSVKVDENINMTTSFKANSINKSTLNENKRYNNENQTGEIQDKKTQMNVNKTAVFSNHPVLAKNKEVSFGNKTTIENNPIHHNRTINEANLKQNINMKIVHKEVDEDEIDPNDIKLQEKTQLYEAELENAKKTDDHLYEKRLHYENEENYGNEKKNPQNLENINISNINQTNQKTNEHTQINNNLKSQYVLNSRTEMLRTENNDLNKTQISEYRKYNQHNIENASDFLINSYIINEFNKIKSDLELKYEDDNVLKDKAFDIKEIKEIDDRIVVRFTKHFIQIMEKSIYLFNMKRYEESYSILKESNIISGEVEFAEFLLISKGIDKTELGLFLSMNNSLNKDLCITVLFMKHIEFEKTKLIIILRFLLSLIILPDDQTLSFNVVEKFTYEYYKCHLNEFHNRQQINTLANSMISLNTFLHKPHLFKSSPMSPDDFYKINQSVSPSTLLEIYNEIQINKFEAKFVYTEMIYRRLTLWPEETILLTSLNTTTSVNEEEKRRLETLLGDELLKKLVIGHKFTKYTSNKKSHEKLVKLSEDFTKIVWKTTACIAEVFKIEGIMEISELVDVKIGSTSSKTFQLFTFPPEHDSHCLSIQSEKRTLDIFCEDIMVAKCWFQAIKFLIKKQKYLSNEKKKKIKESNNINKILENFWITWIIPDWKVYREYIVLKGKERIDGTNHLRIKNIDFTKFDHDLNEADRKDVVYLFMMGLPYWIRKKLWPIIIGNELSICESLFAMNFEKIEILDFDDDGTYKEANKDNFTYEIEKEIYGCNFGTRLTVEEQMNLIYRALNKNEKAIYDAGMDRKEFKADLFKILRVFSYYRPDIIISHEITQIATILLLVTEKRYAAFQCLCNMVINSYLVNFLSKNNHFIKSRSFFFESILLKYLPKVHLHFKSLGITTDLFYYEWMEFMFSLYAYCTFKIETLKRIWDCFLVRGEIFFYELALAIIMVQEEDMLTNPVNQIFKNLKKFPAYILEDDLFDCIFKINISEDYKKLNEECCLAYEKAQLFECFF